MPPAGSSQVRQLLLQVSRKVPVSFYGKGRFGEGRALLKARGVGETRVSQSGESHITPTI